MLNVNELSGFGAGGDNLPVSASWKLTFAGGTYLFAREIEMRGVSGGPDLCSGGVATGATTFYLTPDAAFDNDVGSPYGISGTDPTRYMGYNFAAPVSVAEIAYTEYEGSSPTEITLWYLNSLSVWVALKTWPGLTWTGAPETKILTI